MNEKIELVAVFKKEISPETAAAILSSTGVPYHEGMDSSRGKIYFYSTGPKFILTIATAAESISLKATLEQAPEIHEVYEADWTKCKD